MKKALALSALPLVFLFVTAFQSSNSVPAQLAAIQAKLDGLEGPRKFYLTKTPSTPLQALSACAPGYHMASMWEIQDPSNLRYNTELGETREDSGAGPPAGGGGWIRTGTVSSRDDLPGVGNCRAWTSVDPSHYGSGVTLHFLWTNPAETASPWLSFTHTCGGGAPVWCVQD